MKFEQTVIDGGEAGFVMVEQSLAGQDLNKEEIGEVKDAFLAYMTKVASDPQLKIKTKAIYEKSFTDNEITALISFVYNWFIRLLVLRGRLCARGFL
jgi:hypothetical protein